jgi:uncharacterized protein (TIGR02145 family)
MAVVTIGTQKWSDANLSVSTFQDGTPISEISSSEQWDEYAAAGTPGWCYYNFDSGNAQTYGKLYNWYAVSSSNAICPTGFRIPTNSDFSTLATHLGGQLIAGVKMKNTDNWLTLTRRNSNGTNSSGFKGNPGGYVKSGTYDFWDQGWSANFWTQTTASASEVVSRRLYWSDDKLNSLNAPIDMGLSVRLLCTGSTEQCSDGDFDITNMF